MKRTLVKGGLTVTFIHEGYHAIKIKRADLLLEGDTILAVGEALQEEGARVIDASGCLVLPGLVNIGSSVLAAKLTAGLLPDEPRERWQGTLTYARMLPLLDLAAETLTRQELRQVAAWGLLDALRCGSTTLVEAVHQDLGDVVASAAQALGVRAYVVCLRTACGLPWTEQNGKLHCPPPEGGSFTPGVRQDGLARQLDGLYSAETASPEQWKAASGQTPLVLYGGYSEYEKQVCRLRYGVSPISRIRQAGGLCAHTLVLQPVLLDAADRQQLRTAGASAAFSAVWALQEAQAAPIVPLLAQDVNCALGTGYYGVNMLEELRACAYAAKLQAGRAAQFQASDSFYAATIAGARALGEKLGRLEVGFAADLMLVDTARLQPLNYPLRQLVYQAQPEDVRQVFVAGECVWDLRRDGARLQEAASAAAGPIQRLWAAARRSIL